MLCTSGSRGHTPEDQSKASEEGDHLQQLSALLQVILPLLSLTTLAQLLQNPGKPVELLPEIEKMAKSVRIYRTNKS